MQENTRGVAQLGRASGLGPEGRRFKSCRPDQRVGIGGALQFLPSHTTVRTGPQASSFVPVGQYPSPPSGLDRDQQVGNTLAELEQLFLLLVAEHSLLLGI